MGRSLPKNIIVTIKSGLWTNVDVSADKIRIVMEAYRCPACLMAKRNKDLIPQSVTNPREVHIGQLISRMFLFPFGTPVVLMIPKRTWQFDKKNEIGIFSRHSEDSVRGGLVYFPSTRAIVTRIDMLELKIDSSSLVRYVNTRNGIKLDIGR